VELNHERHVVNAGRHICMDSTLGGYIVVI